MSKKRGSGPHILNFYGNYDLIWEQSRFETLSNSSDAARLVCGFRDVTRAGGSAGCARASI